MTVEQPDPCRAVVDRREQLAAEPRPRPVMVTTTDTVEMDMFRLYRREWTIMYTAAVNDNGYQDADLLPACRTHFETTFAGRVRDEDVRYELVDEGTAGVRGRLLLRLPVLKGEFKHATAAFDWAVEQGWDDVMIVPRNSAIDHNLRSYSIKKLPA